MRPDVTLAISIAATLAVVCVGALRLVDVNEKEPFWALALLLWLGMTAAAVTALVADPQSTAYGAALLAEGPKTLAIVAGLAALGTVGRRRGVSELNSPLDWLLYGAAAGAGFAIGDGFLRATFTAGTELQSPDPRNTLELLWMTVQSCLSEAAFGAIVGGALGLAADRPRTVRLAALPAGFAAAFCAHWAYATLVLDEGVHAPGFSWAGLAAVLLIVALVAAGLRNALRGEVEVIRDKLAGEAEDVVSAADRELLSSPRKRYRSYVEMLAAGDLDGWWRARRRHDHEVALAFAKQLGGDACEEAAYRRQAIRHARQTGAAQVFPRGAAAAATAVVIAGGAVALALASGGEEPSTFATRTSLAERDIRRVTTGEQRRRALRSRILLIPAEWRPRDAGEHDALLEDGALEAYELEYAAPAGGTVHYAIARYRSASAAGEAAERLKADGDAWAQDDLVAQVRGGEELRRDFCAALGTPGTCQP
jgi:RsiW-degrading membrane proteinase PrsW (M82 family)